MLIISIQHPLKNIKFFNIEITYQIKSKNNQRGFLDKYIAILLIIYTIVQLYRTTLSLDKIFT